MTDPKLRPIDDVLGAPGTPIRLLICGINPGTRSAQTNRHYAGPGNRFWPALSGSGLVPYPVTVDDQHMLPDHGIGLTNLVARPTATAAEVSREELRQGAARLQQLADELDHPQVAILGVTTYRMAFRRPKAQRGTQPDNPGFWVLDNPSGLNAHTSAAKLADDLAAVGRAAGLTR